MVCLALTERKGKENKRKNGPVCVMRPWFFESNKLHGNFFVPTKNSHMTVLGIYASVKNKIELINAAWKFCSS